MLSIIRYHLFPKRNLFVNHRLLSTSTLSTNKLASSSSSSSSSPSSSSSSSPNKLDTSDQSTKPRSSRSIRRAKYPHTGKRNKDIKLPVMNIYHIFKSLREYARAKFDETVEIAVKLAVDPRKPNQSIKSVAKLPHGNGKTVRVAVFAIGEDVQMAKDAGADVVGSDDLIKAIQAGEINFDRVIATPEMMAQVGKIGKILGPKGLMPNPKLGTVTKEIVKAIKAAKQGSVPFRVDNTGIIHAGIGKISFSDEALLENIRAFMLAVGDAKPEGFKSKYIETVHICSSMGPGIKIDLSSVDPSSSKFFLDPTKLS